MTHAPPALIYRIRGLSDGSARVVRKRSHAFVNKAAYNAQTQRDLLIRINGRRDDLEAVLAAAEDEYRTAEREEHRYGSSAAQNRQTIHHLDRVAHGVALVVGIGATVLAYLSSTELGMNVAHRLEETSYLLSPIAGLAEAIIGIVPAGVAGFLGYTAVRAPVRIGIYQFIMGNPHRVTDRHAYWAVRQAAIAASVELTRRDAQAHSSSPGQQAQAT